MPEDFNRVVDFAQGIVAFEKKLEFLPEHKTLKDYHLYEQLLEVCKSVVKRMSKLNCNLDEEGY